MIVVVLIVLAAWVTFAYLLLGVAGAIVLGGAYAGLLLLAATEP